MATNYTPSTRKIADWILKTAESKGMVKKAYQSMPPVIFYETETKIGNALDKLIEEFQQEEGGSDDKLKDIEKRIEEAKTPEELKKLEEELNQVEDSGGEAKEEEKAPEAPKDESSQTPAPAPQAPAQAPVDDTVKTEIENLKKEIEELKGQGKLEEQVKQLKKQVENLEPLDDSDMNDSLNQSASIKTKIAYFQRQIRRKKATSDLNTQQIQKLMDVVYTDDLMSYQEMAKFMSKKIDASEQDIYDFLLNADTAYGIRKNINQRKAKINPEINQEKEFLKSQYRMLDRLEQDCKYFLGNGNGHIKHLWAKDIKGQISEMKKIYNSFTSNKKPDWIDMDKIEDYEKKMLDLIANKK